MNTNNRDKMAQVRQNNAAPRPAAALVPIEEGEERNAIHLYLREIGPIKRLTPEEEVALARRVQKGDAEAREQMIKANLRLVVKIAHDYEGYGVPLLDLISEGNLGLVKAVERFDPARGAKFSTYGVWWIKQAIRRALCNQSKTIRLPVHVIDRLAEMRRATPRLAEALGREPTARELAKELGLDVRQVNDYQQAAMSIASLDAPLSDESGSDSVAEVVADDKAQNPAKALETQADLAALRNLLGDLEEREITVLRRRFGLDGVEEQTLEEIGDAFGVTRERVRQIETAALKKLRHRMDRLDTQHFPA